MCVLVVCRGGLGHVGMEGVMWVCVGKGGFV